MMAWLRSMAWMATCALAATSACAAESRAISVHVLDQVRGQPAPAMGIKLEEQSGGGDTWKLVARKTTDANGRVASLLPEDEPPHKGTYRVTFATGGWFEAHAQSTFFPSVTVTFRVDDPAQGYHIPLLLSPFGYSTYRGN
ncbi:hydroxyisourate hydrolase [Dyella sp. LX-66]|nr:hydroxyisourate hydrolase [Dyella sp. LX-1]MBT2140141.1 hydroxyisourate hydrolase [Dyella sp. LX-66]